MLSVTNLKAGTIFEDQGQIYKVLSYEHIKMGRGSANISVRVKNVRTQALTEKTFISGAKVFDLQIQKQDLQFLYKDQDEAFFMDPKTFVQISVPLGVLDGHVFLKEGEVFTLSFLGEEPLSLDLPPKMEFKVAQTGPSVRGNTTSNIFKDAILESGLKTKVPLFIKEGDRVRIDTRTGEYSERV